eukprot:TRINITY_DN125_c0_g1_i9.p1 TRINITY_DN125_c0_g1~~TRINITY_DN125_c0_g1_i9.p1  ORF type:complete len:136 (+),score=5.63 TRINITY_DN125_c0_g1_i9:142-549(+)
MLLKVVLLVVISMVLAQYPPIYPPYLDDSCTNAGDQASHIAADEACEEVKNSCLGYSFALMAESILPPFEDISLTQCQSLYTSKCEGGCNSKYFNCLVKYSDLSDPSKINCVLPNLFFNFCDNKCQTGFIKSVTN